MGPTMGNEMTFSVERAMGDHGMGLGTFFGD